MTTNDDTGFTCSICGQGWASVEDGLLLYDGSRACMECESDCVECECCGGMHTYNQSREGLCPDCG